MKIAILGYAQAGKRTIFRLLTGREVPASRKEGETVDGIAAVRDPRVDAIAAICKPKKLTYAEVRYALCPDVSTDNERPWLESARKAEAICLIVRAFEDESVYHPAGSVDAARDRLNLETELALADLELTEKRLTRIGKEKRAGTTSAQELEERVLTRAAAALGGGQRLSELTFTEQELGAIRNHGFLTLKPVVIVRNVAEADVSVQHPGEVCIAGLIEKEISELDTEADRLAYLKDLGLEALGVDRLNAATYDLMGLMSYYTMGPDEARAWTVRKGARAPEAAGKIHSDIERGFIRAEIIRFSDLIAAGTEEAVKARGQVNLRGKDYVVEDGDICHFLFNV